MSTVPPHPPPPPDAAKADWRRWAKTRRAATTGTDASQRVCAALRTWTGYRRARHVLLYLAFGDELDLSPLLDDSDDARSRRPPPDGRPTEDAPRERFPPEPSPPHPPARETSPTGPAPSEASAPDASTDGTSTPGPSSDPSPAGRIAPTPSGAPPPDAPPPGAPPPGGLVAAKRFYVTRTWRAPRRLSLHRLEVERLERHPLGYLHPPADAPETDPGCIDLALVPGLAFDRAGGRLGYGLGYYDRLLPLLPPTTPRVGVALEALVVPVLPQEPRDVPMTALLTERGVRPVDPPPARR